MAKKVLIVHYSQTGQLSRIVENFSTPFEKAGMAVESIRVGMEREFNFPWTSTRFFDAMPESVLCIPSQITHFNPSSDSYDLIIFAYQPWYLSPSIPATSILANEEFRKRIKGKPVVTLIGARNMWLNAQEKVKVELEKCGAELVANIVLTDEANNFVSAVTILHWMLSGKQEKYLGIFPRPGISEKSISSVSRFGTIVCDALIRENFVELQKQLLAAGAVTVKTNLMFIEARAGKLFLLWAKTIIKKRNRRFWLKLFKYYLLIALFVIAPIVLTVYMLIFKPFLGASIRRKKDYFRGVTRN
jgi:hypothetical protein